MWPYDYDEDIITRTRMHALALGGGCSSAGDEGSFEKGDK